jgi:hypothetical protein
VYTVAARVAKHTRYKEKGITDLHSDENAEQGGQVTQLKGSKNAGVIMGGGSLDTRHLYLSRL